MDNLEYVIKYAYNLMQVRLDFGSYWFTSWGVDIALLILAIAIDWVLDVINR